MKTIQLQTNIMCGACIAKVTPELNKVAGEGAWKVDIQNPKKVLTVTNNHVSEEEVVNAVQKAGYKAEAYSNNNK